MTVAPFGWNRLHVERFVRFLVVGGLALVAGLWLTALYPFPGPLWLLGVALALGGVAALAVGIESQVDWSEVEF